VIVLNIVVTIGDVVVDGSVGQLFIPTLPIEGSNKTNYSTSVNKIVNLFKMLITYDTSSRFVKYSQTGLKWHAKGTFTYGHIRQVVAKHGFI
jgi:fructose-1,6-bisphosphatase